MERLRRSFPAQFLRCYFYHDIPRTAAALTYYLIFSIFPLTIFFSTLLGALELNAVSIAEAMSRFVPHDVVEFVESYINYVNQNINFSLLSFALVFSIYFPMRAADTLMRAARRAYHLQRPEKLLRYLLKNLIYTLLFIFTIALSLFLVVISRKAMAFFGQYIPIPAALLALWPWLRYGIMALIMFFLLAALHVFAQDNHRSLKSIFPGVILSLAAWLFVSAAFSFYVTNFSNYSLLYGSIGAIVVLLLWLYLSSIVMIMGAEFNALLIDRKKKS